MKSASKRMLETPLVTFSTMRQALATLEEPHRATALYVSSGSDTKPFAFLHPMFLTERGLIEVPAPTTYVFVDNGVKAGALGFEDGRTRITTLTHSPVRVAGRAGSILEVCLESDEAGWNRTCKVLRLEASNDDVYRIAAKEGWTPDMFIAVCDGCRLGGNDRCENSLSLEESPLRLLEPPAWWVTEHFTPLSGHFGPEDVIDGLDPDFPVRFVKLGMLSPAWGTYGATLFGATVFRVEGREA